MFDTFCCWSTKEAGYLMGSNKYWKDDDNMVPNYTDLLDLNKKIKQLFPDMETTIKYGEKRYLNLNSNCK